MVFTVTNSDDIGSSSRIGMRVSVTNNYQEGDILGTITCAHTQDTPNASFCLKRDDGERGAGCGNTWHITGNTHGTRVKPTEWHTGTWSYTASVQMPKKKKTLMSYISLVAKKLLDADLKILLKAGWLNEDLSLNDRGRRALADMLLLERKTDLAALAAEEIKERKEEEDDDE